VSVSDDERAAERIRRTRVTVNAFGILRQQPLLGRDFAADEDAPGADAVVILGFDLWRTRYGSDPGVLGRTIRVNRQPATVIAVMPEGMKFPDNSQIWQPLIARDASQRESRSLTVFGRVRDGIEQRQVQAEFRNLAGQFRNERPDLNRDLIGINVETFAEAFIGGMGRTMFIIIMVAVTLVLLIACANVANLLLARSGSRAREIALRMALGATRRRVIRQLLTESVVLALLGGTGGLLLADTGIGLFARSNTGAGLPYWVVFELDYVVFGYLAAICAATALVFGLAPALQVSKANAHTVLKESGRSVLGAARTRWFSSGMVIAEIAMTIVLLGGAGLMFRSFLKLYSVDVGADINPLLAMRLELPVETYPDAAARHTFFRDIEQRVGTIAGIESVSTTTGVPPDDGGERLLEVDGSSEEQRPRFVSTVTISPSFFAVLKRPVIRGRNFNDSDGAPGAETVIINERLAGQFFPGADPIGRRLRFTQRQPRPGQPVDAWRTVIGISAPIHHGSPQDGYVNAVAYLPYRQETPRSSSLLMRSSLPPATLMEAIRREVRAVDRDQPVFSMQTVQDQMAGDRWLYRVYGGVFAVLAIIAIALSFVGVYAVISYSVAQRTQEIGVRMAVGARRGQVSWLVLKRGVVQLAVGLPLGLAGAFALGVVIERMLVDMTPADPVTFAAITVVLSAVSLGACLIPARRASRVDPMIALRAE
jgi:putative ABC transport system permease protein